MITLHRLSLRLFLAAGMQLTILLNGSGARAADLHVPSSQYPDLQTAITLAAEGDQIILAPGTYRGAGFRNLGLISKNLTITGNGLARDCIIDCEGKGNFLALQDVTDTTTISYLTIKNASDSAMTISFGGSPMIFACDFSNNVASEGSAARITDNATPTFRVCTFSQNSATTGGAIALEAAGATLDFCDFDSNVGLDAAGAVFSEHNVRPSEVQLTLTNCTFTNNHNPATSGGAMVVLSGNMSMKNCKLTGNTATLDGGALSLSDTAATLYQCSFSQNKAGRKGGALAYSGDVTITNCILSGDSPDEVARETSAANAQLTIAYTTLAGGLPPGAIDGGGNDSNDPRFVNPAMGDLRLRPDSPCVDTGNNALLPPDLTDLDGDGDREEPLPWDAAGNPRLVGGTVDRGAYELPGTPGVDIRVGITLSRDSGTGEILATVTLRNRGTATAEAVQLTDIRLGGTLPGAALPTPTISLDGATVNTQTFRFPFAPTGQRSVLKVTGRYQAGAFGGMYRVTTP